MKAPITTPSVRVPAETNYQQPSGAIITLRVWRHEDGTYCFERVVNGYRVNWMSGWPHEWQVLDAYEDARHGEERILLRAMRQNGDSD